MRKIAREARDTVREARDIVLRLRVSKAEKEAWENAARKEDRPLSTWIRHVSNAAVK